MAGADMAGADMTGADMAGADKAEALVALILKTASPRKACQRFLNFCFVFDLHEKHVKKTT